LDGIAVLVSDTNKAPGLTFANLASIYNCAVTKWEDIPGSNLKGAIKVLRRDDKSGTTDAFKGFVGVTAFGACVTIVDDKNFEIGKKVAVDPLAIGYTFQAAAMKGNRLAAIAKLPADKPVALSEQTVRDGTYPMSRKLFVYEASGSFQPNADEK